MKIKRHHFYTLLLTFGMMLGALALLFINQWLGNNITPQVEVREIHVASLPPPPPPAPQQVQQVVQDITLSLEGDGPAMDISLVKVEQPQIQLTPPPIAMQMEVDFSDSLVVDWQAFGLDQLDNIPKLLTRAKNQYPRSLVKQGVLQTIVKLDVFIDEAGKPTLINARGQHVQALTPSITKLVKRARFSPPTKDGSPVSARFVWPVEFKKT